LTTARFRVLGRKDGLVARVVQAIEAQILAGTTHNPLLILLLDSIRDLMAEVRTQVAQQPGLFQRVMPTHIRILERVASRDAKGARQAMREHLLIALTIQRDGSKADHLKIGLAVAAADAPPSAFVVFRDDLCRCVDRCAALGYDGVELALRFAGEVSVPEMKRRLAAAGIEVPCISSGQVFAADHLYFTHPDAAVERITDMIRLAAEFGAKVNTGRVRGTIHPGEAAEAATARYLQCMDRCADVAEPLGVELIVEPVNRYEVNFINNCEEGLEVVRRIGRPRVKLMLDLFHMNIEDASFREAFVSAKDYITYVHVADSNRLAPGWGHLPFDEVFAILYEIGYDGYLTAEILPKPAPDLAARQAVKFLRPRIEGLRR